MTRIWLRIRSLLGICRGRHAAGSTCSCSTHRLSSSPASWSPDVPMSMWLRNNVRLTSLKNFSKVHIFWGLTSSRPAKIGVRCFLIPGRGNVWKKSKEQIWDEMEWKFCEIVSHPVREDKSGAAPDSTGSARSQQFAPRRSPHSPEKTTLKSFNTCQRLCFYNFALSHLFRGDVVHCLLVTSTTKWSERKIASGHVVKSHLIERISRICICEGADIDC